MSLVIGVAVTVLGYANKTAVDLHWSVFQIDGVPVWMVAVVPVAIVLVAGTWTSRSRRCATPLNWFIYR